MSGVAVAPVECGCSVDAKNGTQESQQQFDGSTTVVSESPVSSIGGWRYHGKSFQPERAGFAF